MDQATHATTDNANNRVDETRQHLYEIWVNRTGHRPSASNGTWACEIARSCRTCNEHLSLPCSLLAEANEIGSFLRVPHLASEPIIFLRLYLILLDEFTSRLEDAANLLGLKPEKRPTDLAVWTNKWAKHRMHFLILHHPTIFIPDRRDGKWTELEDDLPGLIYEDDCGNRHDILVIDTEWLKRQPKSPDIASANDHRRAVIAVPPLDHFLHETCNYYRRFVDEALKVPEDVRSFESEHLQIGCG